jgi:hypothetical protein
MKIFRITGIPLNGLDTAAPKEIEPMSFIFIQCIDSHTRSQDASGTWPRH